MSILLTTVLPGSPDMNSSQHNYLSQQTSSNIFKIQYLLSPQILWLLQLSSSVSVLPSTFQSQSLEVIWCLFFVILLISIKLWMILPETYWSQPTSVSFSSTQAQDSHHFFLAWITSNKYLTGLCLSLGLYHILTERPGWPGYKQNLYIFKTKPILILKPCDCWKQLE